MDEIKTGVFEISTTWNDFWKDWQLELAKEDLRRRARAAMDKIMREGVPYVTCLRPAGKRGDKLVLIGFCVLASWADCEVGEACYVTSAGSGSAWALTGRVFQLEAQHTGGPYDIYIYRRAL